MKLPKIERRSNAEMRKIRQAQIDRVRKGGFHKQADRAQRRLDKKNW